MFAQPGHLVFGYDDCFYSVFWLTNLEHDFPVSSEVLVELSAHQGFLDYWCEDEWNSTLCQRTSTLQVLKNPALWNSEQGWTSPDLNYIFNAPYLPQNFSSQLSVPLV